MKPRLAIGAVAVAVMLAGSLGAQATGVTPLPKRGAAARVAPGQRERNAAQQPNAANRVALERQVRQALAKAARRQLGLNATQMTQLMTVDQKFERQRRLLAQQQRRTRLALRSAMVDSAATASPAIAQQLDSLILFERRRIDLMEAEQKELATFLTPLQRAKYQALQERVRRRLEEMRVGPATPDSTPAIRPDRPPR